MNNKNPMGIMKIKGFGEIKFELYPEIAPITVSNFIDLVKKGLYNPWDFEDDGKLGDDDYYNEK